jgi:hypothetical protein
MPGNRGSTEINWPMVAGVAIVGGVAVYLLYSVNTLLAQLEAVTLTPLSELENGIGTVLNWLNPSNWFSSNNSASGN